MLMSPHTHTHHTRAHHTLAHICTPSTHTTRTCACTHNKYLYTHNALIPHMPHIYLSHTHTHTTHTHKHKYTDIHNTHIHTNTRTHAHTIHMSIHHTHEHTPHSHTCTQNNLKFKHKALLKKNKGVMGRYPDVSQLCNQGMLQLLQR